MGIKGDESSNEIYRRYVDLTYRAKFVDIAESNRPLDALAEEVYAELLEWKEKHVLL